MQRFQGAILVPHRHCGLKALAFAAEYTRQGSNPCHATFHLGGAAPELSHPGSHTPICDHSPKSRVDMTGYRKRQPRLFNAFEVVLTEGTRRRMEDHWPSVFRHVILKLMPVDTLRQHFHPRLGRPTKELYYMAGSILLMEFRNWTMKQAVNAYLAPYRSYRTCRKDHLNQYTVLREHPKPQTPGARLI
jgi:hypothetical protein